MHERILLVDGHSGDRQPLRSVLDGEGYEVRELESALDIDRALEEFAPHVVICDVMMPGRDGLSICRRIRSDPALESVQVLFVSAKPFEGDQRAALEAGAAGYLLKPVDPDKLRTIVRESLANRTKVRIWGCRGSVPTPEWGSGRYGGNTSCVELLLSQRRRLILDAGTGIRRLGNEIVSLSPMRLTLCLTHYHWDHIQGLPFFKPLYVAGNRVEIHGPAEDDTALAEKIRGEMGGDYFPVSLEAFMASVRFVAVGEYSFETVGIPVKALFTFHPGRTLAYRVDYGGRSVVYAPDNELSPDTLHGRLFGEARRFARFAAGASLLIHDATYSASRYRDKQGWGHSSPQAVAHLAAHAHVERVLLFHHEPDNSDAAIAALQEEFARTAAALGVTIPAEPAAEGMTIEL